MKTISQKTIDRVLKSLRRSYGIDDIKTETAGKLIRVWSELYQINDNLGETIAGISSDDPRYDIFDGVDLAELKSIRRENEKMMGIIELLRPDVLSQMWSSSSDDKDENGNVDSRMIGAEIL